MPNKLPKHIVRLLFLLVIAVLLALVARTYLIDPSFYRFGHYRGDAIPELASGTPVFLGSAYCLTCHAGEDADKHIDRNVDWAVGVHRTVQCEVCHGTAPQHPDDGKSLLPVDRIKLCTTCHLAITGRPATQPQIVLGEHPFPDEETPQCTDCHNPHSPLDMQEEEAGPAGSAIDAPAITSKCAKCHGLHGEGVKKNPVLAGLESAVFVERMNLYKSGARENKIMVKFAKALSDEEIAELAGYFESLGAKSPE
jgi:cytochrome c553